MAQLFIQFSHKDSRNTDLYTYSNIIQVKFLYEMLGVKLFVSGIVELCEVKHTKICFKSKQIEFDS